MAGAAVRVAAENWASAPPQDTSGPLEQALLNLAVLRDFDWEDGPMRRV